MSKPMAKQTSISAFFTPKSGGNPKKTADVVAPTVEVTKSKPLPKAKPAAKANGGAKKGGKSNGKKKAAEEDEDFEMDSAIEDNEDAEEEDDDAFIPTPRSNVRRVSSKRPIESISDGDGSHSDTATKRARKSPTATPEASDTPVRPATKKSVVTNRTARFALGSQIEPEELDAATQRERDIRHEKYVRKLGRGGIVRAHVPDDDFHGEGEGEDDEEMEEDEPAPPKRGKGAAATKKKKLTPLEKQVVDLKAQYPDTLLVIEVGYKFRFFGEDARIAAKELSIMCIPGKMRFDEHPSEAHLDKFASASIPVHRLHVHVKRLVEAGHKVGVVRQLETAALKAVGDNRNAPFVRKLTNLYTKGTYVDDIDSLGDTSTPQTSSTGFLLCITEKPGGGSGADERCRVGIVAVQPSTGDVVYDEFDDGFMRSEVETRLLHIAPCEFLIVGELTKATDKLVKYLAGSKSAIGAKVRVERVASSKNIAATSSVHVSKFYADKLENADTPEARKKNALYEAVMGLPEMVIVCLSSMINHLTAYGLEHVFDLTKYFQSFSARTHMLLNGNTLSSLEIYQNQTEYTEKGSLFWTLDKTKTKFGRRLLRNWVGRPLLDKAKLEERLEAVEEMIQRQNPKIERLIELLTKVNYDLEKGLIRIYYGKCSRPEVLSVLSTMLRIANTFPKVDDPEEMGFKSPLINKALAALPVVGNEVAGFLDEFNHQAAAKDDKYNFFKESDDYDKITEHKLGIVAVEHDIDEERQGIAKELGKKRVDYVTVAGVEFLVEVPNDKASLKAVPPSWQKISGTKKVSRFHTPRIKNLMQERDQQKELLAAACDEYYKKFLAKISESYQALRDTVQSLALLDCLLSLATVAKRPNYCKPTFVSEPVINIVDGRHPMIEALALDAYVPNSISLSSESLRALLVTGPNMGGKSSYVRQTALIAIMAQIGSYVPAASAELGLLDAVFTRMGAFDNLLAGESTFMVELSETSEILKTATPRSLVILDELGRGTSTQDGVAIAYAVLEHIVRSIRSMTLFVTHYPLLGAVAEQWRGEVGCVHMKFEETGDGNETITFLYQIEEGLAYRSYGLNVGRLAGLPESCLEVAGVKSRELEKRMRTRERLGASKLVGNFLKSSDIGDEDIEKLIDCIGML